MTSPCAFQLRSPRPVPRAAASYRAATQVPIQGLRYVQKNAFRLRYRNSLRSQPIGPLGARAKVPRAIPLWSESGKNMIFPEFTPYQMRPSNTIISQITRIKEQRAAGHQANAAPSTGSLPLPLCSPRSTGKPPTLPRRGNLIRGLGFQSRPSISVAIARSKRARSMLEKSRSIIISNRPIAAGHFTLPCPALPCRVRRSKVALVLPA